MAKTKLDITDVAGYRRKSGKNQSQFWSTFGVTQSGGSRYESGRNVPKPIALLLSLYANGKINDDDLTAAAAALKKARKSS